MKFAVTITMVAMMLVVIAIHVAGYLHFATPGSESFFLAGFNCLLLLFVILSWAKGEFSWRVLWFHFLFNRETHAVAFLVEFWVTIGIVVVVECLYIGSFVFQ